MIVDTVDVIALKVRQLSSSLQRNAVARQNSDLLSNQADELIYPV
jgi:hypothetical protein